MPGNSSAPDSAAAERLMAEAREAAGHAYAPYSKFRVGAALLFDDGYVATGCNVENVSFGLTICAERNAIFRAIAERGAKHRIVAIAVTNLNGAASPPCGACRQVLSEFAAADAVVYFPGEAGMETQQLATLLPFGFHLNPQ